MQQGKKKNLREPKLQKIECDRQNIQLKCTARLPWQLASMWIMTSVRIQCKLYREMNCHVSDIDRSERGTKKKQRSGWPRLVI